jgi:Helix-turn-helix domain
MNTQKEIVKQRLQEGDWVPMTYFVRHSPPILRVSARIFDLRAEGHNIIERKVAGKSYSEYKLIPPNVPKLPPAFEPKTPERQSLFG